jgi:hypothetical protein
MAVSFNGEGKQIIWRKPAPSNFTFCYNENTKSFVEKYFLVEARLFENNLKRENFIRN